MNTPRSVSDVELSALTPEPGRHGDSPRSTTARIGRRIRAVLSVAGLVAFSILVAKRADLATSFGRIGHPRWSWIVVGVALECASMEAFAWMQRRLLRLGGTRVDNRSMLATTLAANALSVSVPIAGAELGAALSFRRFKRQGADGPLAGWSLLMGGLVSVLGVIAIVVGGGVLSRNVPATVISLLAGVSVVGVATAVRAAALSSRFGLRVERPAVWVARQLARVSRRPVDDPRETIKHWLQRVQSFHLSRSEWIKVGGLGLTNWVADAAVLATSIVALGDLVPWRSLLLVYAAATVVGSAGITPGGIGLVEGTLCVGLVRAGLPAGQALVAVLLYRLVSFWLVTAAGWLVLLYLRFERPARAASLQGVVTS
jgi:putative heme transporter